MKTSRQIKGLVIALGVMGLAAYSATYADTISVTGTAGTTYPGNDVGQGSANRGREISSATISNDANNLYITLAMDPGGNIENQGAFDYLMVITSGAGGDSQANTNGNPYLRAISIDSGFGGMTDMIGLYGAGGNGGSITPYTSYGFNDWVYTGSSWTQMNNYATGGTIVNGVSNNPTAIRFTVPFSDLSNLNLTPGGTFDFDFDATGTGAGQTAYGDLVLPGPVQGGIYYTAGDNVRTNAGTYSATYQFNETVLDQYTVAVPEPSTMMLVAAGAGSLLFLRRRRG